jgi:hypothetical protein
MSLPTSVPAWNTDRNGLRESTCWVIATRKVTACCACAGTGASNTTNAIAAVTAPNRRIPTVTASRPCVEVRK